jgi:hypothetical protein
MNKRLLKLIASALLLLPLGARADGDGIKAAVSASLSDEGTLWAGQQLTLNLDLKTTGFSFSNTHFNLPEIDGAFLMQIDTTTVKMTERIDGETWQIVRYPLALYAQQAGTLEIPAIDVRFASAAGFGSEATAFELQSEPLEINIGLPAGVKSGDLVVTTTSFTLEHSWQPNSTTYDSGDAVTLSVTRSAADVSAMLLPPLPVFRTEGLAAYPQAPEVSDQTDRGELTGVRTDSIIWVIEQPGAYDIPGIRFQWWDPANGELQQQIVPGISFAAAASAGTRDKPGPAVASSAQPVYFQFWLWALVAALLGVVAWVLLKRKTPAIALSSERSTFSQVHKACSSNNAAQAYAAIHTWFTFLPPPASGWAGPVTLKAFAESVNDVQLAAELEALQKAVISTGKEWQGGRLHRLLNNIRQQALRQKTVQSASRLAPLNP